MTEQWQAGDTEFCVNWISFKPAVPGRRTEWRSGLSDAKQVATAHGGTTLELQLKKNSVVMPPWDPSNPKAVREWEEISKSYAQQQCGLTRGVIEHDLRPGQHLANAGNGRIDGQHIRNPDRHR